MKVKIFYGTDFYKLEEEINDWLKENYAIDIMFVGQSESGAGWTITIWYKEWE